MTMLLPRLDIRIRRLMGCRNGKWEMLDMVVGLIFDVVYYYYCYIDSVRVISCDSLGLRPMVEVRELFRLRGSRLGKAQNSC